VPIAVGIAVFGALGALARYGVDGISRQRLGSGFPWGTFTVNVVGSLAIGLVFALLLGRTDVPEWLKLSITTGFLGGFTTFSAFSLQTHRLLADGAYGLAVAYIVGSVAAGLVAVAVGVLIGRAL
jgi:fluoride exporter